MSRKLGLGEIQGSRYLKVIKSRTAPLVSWPYEFFKRLCFWIGFCVIAGNSILGITIYSMYRSLPRVSTMSFSKLKEVASQGVYKSFEDPTHFRNYRWTELNQIHRDFIYTIIMSEDSSFFEHGGIDYEAILNSAAEDFKKRKYEYGASTISQQVVKNLFLTNEKTIVRKIKELILTSQLEKQFNKNQILEIYLNIAEFGPELFGVASASSAYFKKTPSDINAAEGAFIALMLPSPRKSYYSIYQNKNLPKAKYRKIHRILADMLANGYISPAQFRSYLKYHYFSARSTASPRFPKLAH